MTQLQKYRRLVLGLLIAAMAGLAVCGYLYLRDQVPDYILAAEGEETPVIFHTPLQLLIEEEAVEADSQDASNIPGENLHMMATGTGQTSSGTCQIRCSLLGMIPLKTVQVESTERKSVYAGGFPVGIYLKTEGILVIGTGEVEGLDGQTYEPAEHIVQTGDYIVGADGKALEDKEELVECINASEGRELNLEVLREGSLLEVAVTPVQASDLGYKAGIWVRSDAQGVGTLTYVDKEGNFGALGHGISDVDTSTLLSMKEGTLYEADVLSVTKGEKGKPGELAGVIHYRDSSVLGTIEENRTTGIYGTAEELLNMERGELYEVAYKQEVEPGAATILCCVDGTVKEYEIEIESVDLNKKEVNKGMVIRVTDPELLEKTGGIVQGMSGSPVIQNGRLVGAVTHVFVQDSAKGYGIFAEDMIGQ